MKEKKINCVIQEYNNIDELSKDDALIINRAKEACLNAYSPYSKFSVGAALILENNNIVIGNNQENAAYPSGLCAERVAIFSANAQFPDIPIKSIAISARYNGNFVDKPVPACGSCLQVILEAEKRYNQSINIILVGETTIYKVDSVKQLLPLNFTDDFFM